MKDINLEKILDKHLGILGINGSGKTYTAKGCVELLLDKKERVCIIDPTGVWWGLKSSSTGKSSGYPIVVFGGSHADLPISGMHGETIAEVIGTSNTPAIIDTSLMRGSERTKFFTDFAETLRIKNVGPLHLFIDEAHLFCPQGRVSDPHSAQMLHAANNLISLGRARGLRVTLISQRPAKMHKDSLTQVHSLIAMRLIAPQDREAIENWISDQADMKRGKEIIASLPSLKTGEGYLWAPEFGILEKMKFPKITTFDSSATPDNEIKGDGPVLKQIDLSNIESRLANIKTDAIKNDPIALKRRISELEKQLRDKPSISIDPEALQKSKDEGFREGMKACLYDMAERIKVAKNALDDINSIQIKAQEVNPIKVAPKAKYSPAPRINPANNGDFTGPERRILASLSFWKSIGYESPTRDQVAAVAGYSPIGGAFGNPIGKLRSNNIIDYPSSGFVRLVNEHFSSSMATDEAKNMMLSILGGPEKRIIDAFEGSNDNMSRADVAAKAGYNPIGGAFGNPVGRLCTLGILEKPSSGMLKLSDWAMAILS